MIALAKRKRAAKTAKRGIVKKAMFISPFICLDEGMRHAFDEDTFDRAWKSVKGCINVVHDRHPGLYGVFTRAGEEIRESDGTQRVYRDDWHTQWKGRMGCCPEEVKDIASDMVREFMEKGVTTRFAFGQGIEFLYYSICYAVIRLYLDTLEWENVHTSGVLDGCMDTHGMRGVKTNGERLAMFIVANDPICKTMRLGKYLSRVVDAVRQEGDAVRQEGDAVRQEGEEGEQEEDVMGE